MEIDFFKLFIKLSYNNNNNKSIMLTNKCSKGHAPTNHDINKCHFNNKIKKKTKERERKKKWREKQRKKEEMNRKSDGKKKERERENKSALRRRW